MSNKFSGVFDLRGNRIENVEQWILDRTGAADMRVETLLEHLNVLGIALNDILADIETDKDMPVSHVRDAIEQTSDFVNEITLKFCAREPGR
jgi:hypothetical protein